MTDKKNNLMFKSLEQLKAELFPIFSESEKNKKIEDKAELFGASLADKAVNEVLVNPLC